jgi:hypothetical protein
LRDSTANERPVERGGFKFIRLKSGRLLSFWECIVEAENSHTPMVRAVSRAFKLARDDDDLERIEWFIEHLEEYTAALRRHMDKQRGTLSKQDRIKRLRNTTGRTPGEAALFNEKADQLERAL